MLCSAVCVGLGGVVLATVAGGRGATPAAIILIDLTMAGIAVLGVAMAGRLRAAPAGLPAG
jgi:hypothetical protein